MKYLFCGTYIKEYTTNTDAELARLNKGKNKIPFEMFHNTYFQGKIGYNGRSLLFHLSFAQPFISSLNLLFRGRARHYAERPP